MKSIILSCTPAECEKIANGDMSILVRKKVPKETPFKAYIYCTKANKKYQTICGCMVINTDELYRLPNGKIKHGWSGELMCCNGEYTRDNFLNGKVIGDFICDELEELHEWELSPQGKFADFERERLEKFLTAACLSEEEVVRYRENLPYYKPLYGLHISDLKIYDKPRELSEFISPLKAKKCVDYCVNGICSNLGYEELCGAIRRCEYKKVTRPPKNYIYVEEQENKQ